MVKKARAGGSMRKRKAARRGAQSGPRAPIKGIGFSPEALGLWRASSRENRALARAALRESPSLPRLSFWERRGGQAALARGCALGLPASAFLASARWKSEAWWEWAVARGQDPEQKLRNGWGFEHLAAYHKNEAALAWWARRGGRDDRETAGGCTVWSLGWEGGGEALDALERLWPESAQRGLRDGLARAARFLRSPGADQEPNYLRRFYFAGSLPAMLEALGERPWAAPASDELSALLDDIGCAGGEESERVKALERAAISRAEAREIGHALPLGFQGKKRSRGL